MLSESELLCLYFWISNIAIMHLCHWVATCQSNIHLFIGLAMHILAGLVITQVTWK